MSNNQNILKTILEQEMKTSYLDYAMSVIVSRALPDVRDGLKPVHRRILYTMWKMGLVSGSKFRKSAAVVGETLAKFHPHGDMAVYDALVRMAQDFSLRYPLIQGQGNFGSIDGDPPAAQRYTEVRLSKITNELLTDIEKNTVDFVSNYDATLQEPKVLPSKLPNLLINGSMGIAVGMATNIPPHNLKEVAQAIIYLIDHPDCSLDSLLKFIKGPDFPTGGLIFDPQQIKQVYSTGKGPIVVRSKNEIIENKKGEFNIVVTEIPYGVNKAGLLEKIAQLIKDKKLDEIKDIRDESDKEGLRIVIELKKGIAPKRVLNKLFKYTNLQTSFHVNLVALREGIEPHLFNLKEILEDYLKHRKEVLKRRTEYDLEKTKQRLHILEGFKIALKNLNSVINLIKKSKDHQQAKNNLMKRFKLSEKQALAILEIKLQQLVNLERKKIEDEYKQKTKLKKDLENILKYPKKILDLIKQDLNDLIEKYGDERKTRLIEEKVKILTTEELVTDQPVVIVLTRDGYIKRLSPTLFKSQARGGKGVKALILKPEDIVENLIYTSLKSKILFFSDSGKVFQLSAYEIPEGSRISRGRAIVNFLDIKPWEKISAILSINKEKEFQYLVLATRNGLIKKVDLKNFENVRRSGLIAIKLKPNDVLENVLPCNLKDEILLVSSLGQAIRFKQSDLRPMGRAASGVRGMRLKKDDYISLMQTIPFQDRENLKLLTVTENGFGKKTKLKEFRIQKRAGSGIRAAKINNKTGRIAGAIMFNENNLPPFSKGDLLIISSNGKVIRISLKDIPTLSRNSQGVRLIRLEDKDKVSSVILL